MTLQQQITALEEKLTQIDDAMSFLFRKLDDLTVMFREVGSRSNLATRPILGTRGQKSVVDATPGVPSDPALITRA